MKDELTSNELAILDHTMNRAPMRMYCGDSPVMQDLVAKGFMRCVGKVSWCPDEYFTITRAGQDALKRAQTAVELGRPPAAEAALEL